MRINFIIGQRVILLPQKGYRISSRAVLLNLFDLTAPQFNEFF